ncbi:MAG: sigma-70 family RNA polymerase sigma factor, partial [Anaerolineae bacterium]|nr:sigma-70 family RNA polymerase sigma factor [Anaerolineae bacterium]
MIQELLNRADRRGYVTFEDVLEVLEEDGDEVTTLESILDELDELGIELRQEEVARDEVDETDEEFELEGEEVQDTSIGDINAVSADDPVGLYFRQMAQEPLLTAHEEVELAKRIELGKQATLKVSQLRRADRSQRQELEGLIEDGQAAREHLGRANTRLVVSIAKRYMGQGLPFPDLIQEGNVGLMRAVDKYDYKRGNRFSTYATWWIRQAITRALAQKTRT